jgi:predicted regulator of amino acid metabolism with ACT domain
MLPSLTWRWNLFSVHRISSIREVIGHDMKNESDLVIVIRQTEAPVEIIPRLRNPDD